MKYKYRQTCVVGHKPDGKPIRKEVRSNNKREFDAKVRYYRNLYAKGVQVVGKGLKGYLLAIDMILENKYDK